MCRVYFVGVAKGGSGKTTTADNLADQFLRMGLRVLGVDADGQASWSQLLGLFPRKDRPTLYTAVKQLIETFETRLPIYTLPSGLRFIPASAALHQVAGELLNVERREYVLQQLLSAVKDRFDVIVIDTPPAVNNTWMTNIYVVSDAGVITVQVEPLGIASAGNMLEHLQRLYKRNLLQKDLVISGALLTMMDYRTILHRNLAEIAHAELGSHINFFNTRIERSIQFAEAQFYGQSIGVYSPKGKGAVAYEALAQEVWSGTCQVRVSELNVPPGFADSLLQSTSAAEGSEEGEKNITLEEVYVA